MKKKLVIFIVVGILLGGLAGFVTFTLNRNTTNETVIDMSKAVEACDVLTLDEAKLLLGEAATVGTNTDPLTSPAISIDNCSYTNNAATVGDIRIITLTTRSALNEEGRKSNIDVFSPDYVEYPANAEVVEGLGDKAFWDPNSRQLAILDGDLWLGIVYGGTNPANNTLEDAKKVAELVLN